MNADGWPDIYVASDSTAAILYRNNRDGTFTDTAIESGTAYSENGSAQAGMGLATGDYNNDGLLDFVKTHFADDIPALYRNLGKGLFEDVATTTGLNTQNRHVEWGAGLEDFDNDGLTDLMYVTGNVYPEIERSLEHYPHRGPRVIFRNRDGSRFEDVSSTSGALSPHSSRGAAFGDVDNDGDLDIVVTNNDGPVRLLLNQARAGSHWLQVRLEQPQGPGNRLAFGARVGVERAGKPTMWRRVRTDGSYLSASDVRVHVGLSDSPAITAVVVQWPDGTRERWTDVRADRVLVLRRGTGQAGAPR
jgi:enediyne biosynthesis protein E4